MIYFILDFLFKISIFVKNKKTTKFHIMKAILKIISFFVLAGSAIALSEYTTKLLRRVISYLPKDPQGISAEVSTFFNTVNTVGCLLAGGIFIAVLIVCGKNSSR